MPLEIESSSSPRRAPPPRVPGGGRGVIVGLVNNMPDSALESTETQFTRLLEAAAGTNTVRLRFYSLPEVARAPAAREALTARGYWAIDDLQSAPPDALIVTGMEPSGRPLTEEPYWARFVEVLEWADANTVSSVCSCLAAHAAVLHFDGVQRQRLAQKLFGVFRHRIAPDHPFMAGLAAPLSLPHSRWNNLPPEALGDAGYTILSSSPDTGADSFLRQRRSLFLCFQGHPEYEDVTLLKEYRRDVGRFLRGEQAAYPLQPRDYFSSAASAALDGFRERALKGPRPELLAEFPTPAAAQDLRAPWAGAAARIYSNWLSFIAAAARPGPSARQHLETQDRGAPDL
jgi:homoserine O-succinyltransferase/O-acetyltransferase